MSVTTRIPRHLLAQYVQEFTKQFLLRPFPRAVDIEVVTPDLGDQIAVSGARLIGVTYDPDSDELDIAMDSGDHRVGSPTEVWSIEDDDGFVSVLAIVRPDRTQEIVLVKKVGLVRVR